ncbi:MAG: hypothetical protein KDA25_06735 [Phycisphaerales bacterium]|nr:hypothetical protein [Phycisphaerales bacterium]
MRGCVSTWSFAVAVSVGIVRAPSAHGGEADQYFWEQDVSGNWSCGLCWTPLGPPMSAADAAKINVTGDPYTITLNVNPTIEGFTMDSADARLFVSGGTRVMTVVAQQDLSQSVILAGEVELESNATWICGRGFRINGPSSLLDLHEGTTLDVESLILENAGRITVSNGSPLITTSGGIALAADTTISIASTESLRLDLGGPITGTGRILVNGAADLLVGSIENQSAVIEMSDSSAPIVRGITSTDTLVNGGTIRGAGQLGSDALGLDNSGVVEAIHPANMLLVNIGSPGLANTGVMRAVGGATMRLQHSVIDNTGGVIEAGDGSLVEIRLAPMSITGGTLRTIGSGRIRDITQSDTIDFADVTIDGVYEIRSNGDSRFTGEITNLGVIELQAGAGTRFRVSGVCTLSGGGSILTTDSTANRIDGNGGGSDLLINLDHAIRGAGVLGGASMGIHNDGLIEAVHAASPLTLDTNAQGMINTGTLRASDGATLAIQHTIIDNDGGVIEAAEGSIVTIRDAPMVITGGTLRTTGTGRIRDITVSDTIDFVDVTIDGVYEIMPSGDSRFAGTITNLGTIEMHAGSTARFHVANALTLTGGGTLLMGGNLNNVIQGVGAGTVLDHVDHTIRGTGLITVPMINRGAIIADAAQPLTIDVTDTQLFDNRGSLQAVGAGGLRISRGPFTTSGDVFVGPGSVLARLNTILSDYIQTDGATTVDGTLLVQPGNHVTIGGGTLRGSGTVEGIVENLGGTVEPGASAGVLTITGSYVQADAAALVVELGGLRAGTEHDQLVISGAATLAGTLTPVFIDGFVPEIGDAFTVLTASSITGQFDAVTCVAPMAVTYDGGSVVLTITGAPPGPGDLDCDGVVGPSDLAAMLGSWGPCRGCASDLDGDGEVAASDLAILLANWS